MKQQSKINPMMQIIRKYSSVKTVNVIVKNNNVNIFQRTAFPLDTTDIDDSESVKSKIWNKKFWFIVFYNIFYFVFLYVI